MTVVEFKRSTTQLDPPAGLSILLHALWHDAKGNWDAAHTLAQDVDSKDGAWIHAYLHRKEGDLSNAAYWYRRAGRPVSARSLADEWEEIALALLG
jgi:hypothetical protein